ncbi:OsmC family protein [Rhodococcus erythropolis]|uniref:OsmC family protein n=1 Tax=Rhodococcus erythropolis TaxID=1833 RepID=UPI000878AFAD|nr:OsmC family protein [Rhodococcus erythropolis]OFV79053.1 OsmC-like protein [Rhodococcus erythropolis]
MAGHAPIPELEARRTAAGTFTVRNGTGAELRIGMPGATGVFSPVELLQAALAGCASLSAEAQLVDRLGEEFDAVTTVGAVYDAEQNRVEKLVTKIAVDSSDLDQEEHDRLTSSAARIIDKLCTVKRSLNIGIEATTELERQELGD